MPTRTPITRSFEWLLTLGVFLIFGQVGIFIALLQEEPPGWMFLLVLWGSSGLIALGWSYAINRRGWWFLLLAPLILVPTFGFPRLFPLLFEMSWMQAGADWPPVARGVFAVVTGIVSVSLGFTCVIIYVSRAERAAAESRAELDVAARMHDSLVPDIDHRSSGVEVRARSTPSSDMGGDLVDLLHRGGRVDALLADVSGHGVGAGVVMAMLKAAMRTRLHTDRGSGRDLGALVNDLNRVVYELTEPGMFVTGVWVRVETGGAWRLTLAGHLPALLYRAGQSVVERVENDSLPLGVVEDEAFAETELRVEPGDTLLLITDGLTEVFDGSGA
ncbi:MAG: PP2C family protein-serine/threonine phosphatase, partial [Planctomycetota bacterium]